MSIAEEDIAFRVSMAEGSRLLAQAIADARKGWPIHPDYDRFIWGGSIYLGRQAIAHCWRRSQLGKYAAPARGL